MRRSRRLIICRSCGEIQPHAARRLCDFCYDRGRRHKTLGEWPIEIHLRADVVEEATWLAENLVSSFEWAEKMNMTDAALERALYRAGATELARRVSHARRHRGRESAA